MQRIKNLITSDTGVSIALLVSIVGGVIYFAIFILSLQAKVDVVTDDVDSHEVSDKQLFDKLETNTVTKEEINLKTELLVNKINSLVDLRNSDITKQETDIKRLETKIDRVELKVDKIYEKLK